jgi:hypothetical protein
MKAIFLFLMLATASAANAQYSEDGNVRAGSLRAGVGYVYDFPGMTGTAIHAGYSFSLNEWLQGGIGIKHVHESGYPRTHTVQEYTNANALDFELLFVPLHTEQAALRVGLGYTFCMYSIRRSYAVYTTHEGQAADISYPVSDSKGNAHGAGLVAEYEYYFSDVVSAGLKLQVTKAYDGIIMGGPFVAIRL